jgi:hypothetical protein
MVERFRLTQDGKHIALIPTKTSVSVLHVMETATQKEVTLPKKLRRPRLRAACGGTGT